MKPVSVAWPPPPNVWQEDEGMDDSISRNRAHWEADAGRWVAAGRRRWARDEPCWGIWGIPEARLNLLPDVAGADVVELGCGTAYVSAWLARRGARPTGVDPTGAQLRTAQQLQDEFGLRFPLVQAAGEHVPLRSSSFDLVISEYGAAIWADPYHWIPEAARLLRVGGDLVFLGNADLLMLCVPDEENLPAGRSLRRPQFGMHRMEWPDTVGVEFHLPHGDMIRLLRASGFDVLDLVHLRPDPEATTRFPYVTLDWARQWPSEEAWLARRR
ncbi:MAG: class I SAM-dependent methyltransferase [Acidimicrobiales bacterium]